MGAWLLSHPKFFILLVNIIGLLIIELLVRALAYQGVIPFKQYPVSQQRVLADLSQHYGVWRHPNRTVRHRGACYDVEYSTNSFGMRDKELNLRSEKRRVALLGDSFVEGFGTEASERLSEVAEKSSRIQMLNFGVSGDFSSTQQFLLYRELVSQFDHTDVAVFFLPANDFADNDPSNFKKERYRPYLQKSPSGDFELFYTVPFEERIQARAMSVSRKIRREIYNRVYLFNSIRQLGDAFERSEIKDRVTTPFLSMTDTSYDDYTQQDFKKLTWGYKKIAKSAYPKPVHIFVIPREVDFFTQKNSEQKPQLITDLEEFSSEYDNVRIHDLLPFFQRYLAKEEKDYESVFLSCDGHWSPLGHEVAAGALLSALSPDKLSTKGEMS